MPRTEQMIAQGCVSLQADGRYRFLFGMNDGCQSFTAVWDANTVQPAGRLTFSIDGNFGDPPAVIDLEKGDNALKVNTRLPFVDVDVYGLPEGGRAILYFR